MAVFDPAALPDDFDAKQREDPVRQLEQLMRAGRLYWLDTHADGAYTLAVHVSDRLPDRLQPFAKRVGTCDPFHVPGGRLFFAGIEYVFREDDSFLRKHPHMGEAVELPAGVYRADVFEFQYPEGFHEDLLRQRLPAAPFRAHRLMNTLAPVGCLSLPALLGSLGLLAWTRWAALVLVCALVLLALPLILSRLPAYREAKVASESIRKEFPDYGVLLQTSANERADSGGSSAGRGVGFGPAEGALR